MNTTRLFIEDEEIELDEKVQFAITKQFDDLSNPTTIINDWSKTVSIPFSQKNNKIFGHIYSPDKTIVSGSGSTGIYFDPYKKLSFRLEWNGAVLMVGYAKMNSITRSKGRGTYNVTLNGQLGKLFQEMKKITFDTTTTDTNYLIDGSDIVSEVMDRNLIYASWNSTGQIQSKLYPKWYTPTGSSTKIVHPAYHVTDIIGFAPNNSINEGFDYKTFQSYPTISHTFEETLGDSFTEATGIDPGTAIPNGMLPREIGEYRSYNQLPFVYFNKLFQIFQQKAESITGYTFDLDSEWFNDSNPYWHNLVYMLKKLDDAENTTSKSSYQQLSDATVRSNENDKNPTKLDYSQKTNIPWSVTDAEYDSTTQSFKFSKPTIIEGDITVNCQVKVDCSGLSGKYVKIRSNHLFGATVHMVADGVDTQIGSFDMTATDTPSTPGPKDYNYRVGGITVPSDGYVWTALNEPQTYHIPSTAVNDSVYFYIRNFGYGLGGTSLSMFVRQTDDGKYWTTIEPNYVDTTFYSGYISLGKTELTHKSGASFTFNDLWNKDYNLFTEITNYCKMYHILITVDELNKKIKFIPATKYFSNYTVKDWTDKVDMSKDFTINPISWDKKYILFNYEDSKTNIGEDYKKKYGFNIGEYRLTTDYNFDEDTNKLYSKINPSIVNTDNVLSWSNLYDKKKISYSLPDEIYVYCKDKDNKYKDCFGQYYFHKGLKQFNTEELLNLRSVKISDDTTLQQSTNTYFYSQSQSGVNVSTYPLLDIKTTKENNTLYCTFGIPKESYTYENINSISNKKSIYELFWNDYINERYNIQNKKLTCYLKLRPLDVISFNFNQFILINNQLYMLNKIYDYDVTSTESTKVDLITVQSVDGYRTSNWVLENNRIRTDYNSLGYIGGAKGLNARSIYAWSVTDLNFYNGSKTTTIEGVQFKIESCDITMLDGTKYNYKISYTTTGYYNRDNDSTNGIVLVNSYDTKTLTFTRYRDYPNPPVAFIDSISEGTGTIRVEVRTQFEPIGIEFTGLPSGLTITKGTWDYFNDDYYGYEMYCTYNNSTVGSSSITAKITTGSTYAITKSVSVNGSSAEIKLSDETNHYLAGGIDTTSKHITYAYSAADLNFSNGTKTTVSSTGVKFTISSITPVVVSGVTYNYSITYQLTARYNHDNDSTSGVTITNGYESKSIIFTRYRDYPNPPVLHSLYTSAGSSISGASGSIYIQIRTQMKPTDLVFSDVVGLTITNGTWDYFNDDYYGYEIECTYTNGTFTNDTVSFTVTTASGYPVSGSISVIKNPIKITVDYEDKFEGGIIKEFTADKVYTDGVLTGLSLTQDGTTTTTTTATLDNNATLSVVDGKLLLRYDTDTTTPLTANTKLYTLGSSYSSSGAPGRNPGSETINWDSLETIGDDE